jgi:phosphopantothenoylcysteine decarboxylase
MSQKASPSSTKRQLPSLELTKDPATSVDTHYTVFKASEHLHDGKRHLLLAASGSVATIKIPNMLHALSKHPALSIRLLFTPSASHFLSGQSAEQPKLQSLLSIPNVDGLYVDASEWAKPWERGDPILHIELRRWADVLVIAPLSANMLAKVVNGISDGLLASVVRAWDTTGLVDGKKKRIIVAPAMNTAMWRQPVTARQIRVLEEEWGIREGLPGDEEGWIEVLRPQEKELACGDVGDGAMYQWDKIVTVIEERLGLRSSE